MKPFSVIRIRSPAANSQAEKPWVIFFQPYLSSRPVGYCPSDRTLRSRFLTVDLNGYNGNISSASQTPPPNSELAVAQREHLTIESYLLNSIFTHRSARYALEGVLNGFATDAAINALPNPNIIMFSERNSEALDAPDNRDYGSVIQDDYDTGVGEAALVQWGAGKYGDQGWIRYNRHDKGANYIYTDAWRFPLGAWLGRSAASCGPLVPRLRNRSVSRCQHPNRSGWKRRTSFPFRNR